jgi:hypothetical protein
LDRLKYEGQRPSDAEACRSGDRRFFPRDVVRNRVN